ncbi:MAG: hypothetical protein HYY18_08950 [Planctomycetes bacterium]|nr:hypothetical protein [Planctomycetota bacterium]
MRIAAVPLTVLLATAALGQEAAPPVPEAPKKFAVVDFPFDGGGALAATWEKMPYDDRVSYVILSAPAKEGPWTACLTVKGTEGWKSEAGLPPGGWGGEKDVHYAKITKLADAGMAPVVEDGRETWFRIRATLDDKVLESEPVAATSSKNPPLAAVAEVKFEDFTSDNGSAVAATWRAGPDDEKTTYYVLVAASENGPWAVAESTPGGENFMPDAGLPFWLWGRDKDVHFLKITKSPLGPLQPNEDPATHTRAPTPDWWFRLVAESGGSRWESAPVKLRPEWNVFDWAKLNKFFYMIGFAAVCLVVIRIARGRHLFIRRIPGLDAVDEAVGRATEMGKPIYYLTGRNSMTDVSTVAATLILGEIAKKVATYDTQIKVPHTDAIVMAVCQEITREAYITAGRPDAFREDSNFFVTDDQFGYTAAVDGMMVREKPAACFYMGYYYAEALLLAETGASTGAIQVAGTDADHQLPFFVTACDYTLIGEELYAAGAYLSREPVLVGTLRAQDVGKAVILAGLLILTVVATIAQWVSASETDPKKAWSWQEVWIFDLVRGN